MISRDIPTAPKYGDVQEPCALEDSKHASITSTMEPSLAIKNVSYRLETGAAYRPLVSVHVGGFVVKPK